MPYGVPEKSLIFKFEKEREKGEGATPVRGSTFTTGQIYRER
jgi:hypothetical protein